MTIKNGIDVWLARQARTNSFASARIGVVAHPASLTRDGQHTVDALVRAGLDVRCAFGPQHGMRGDKQDNMIESDDFVDPLLGIPVYSLYGATRRPTAESLDGLDVVVFDLQDIGCRIYTFITTLVYVMQACAARGIRFVLLDRPNPAGRPVDGLTLEPGHESFVGCAPLPTRHGLTVGELARWFVDRFALDLDIEVVHMTDYAPDAAPGYGWPLCQQPWVNPSPNASSLNMARCFPGTVLIEGTTLSEGRGTTVPLEILGAPDIDGAALLETMRSMAPDWLTGVYLRPCFFSPTFHKHAGALCSGLQIHTDTPHYDHAAFRPFRLVALALKAVRTLATDYELWHDHLYEYEPERRAIDVINGGPALADWVDDDRAGTAALTTRLDRDRAEWLSAREPYLHYAG